MPQLPGIGTSGSRPARTDGYHLSGKDYSRPTVEPRTRCWPLFLDVHHGAREPRVLWLELVPPGVVLVSEWRRPESTEPPPTPAEVGNYGGVALKP